MFPDPSRLLAAGEGTIADAPLPLLLQAIFVEGRTVALELRSRALEKRIQFEDGSPVACRSNLLHETLGKFLVEKGKLTEDEYQKALGESVQSGRRMGEVLVASKRIAPFELYRLMQANLALKILDAFRWVDARWRLLDDTEPAELALRVNPARLVFTGSSTFLPFEVVAGGLALEPGQRFALTSAPPHDPGTLKLSPRDARLLRLLKGAPTFEALAAGAGLEVEDAMRRLYALAVLGFVQRAAADEPGRAVAPPSSVAASAPPPPEPEPELELELEPLSAPAVLEEESEELRNDLAARWLAHRGKDPFDLLGVPQDVTGAALRTAFLALADRFAPLRFTSADLREKAEGLLVAHARAYAALADGEQAALWRRRRAAAAEKVRGAKVQPASEVFRIQTNLLDAVSQFTDGQKALTAGNHRAALELFQYAADIEPRASYRAHVAWARYLVDPERHARLSLRELAEAARSEPGSFDCAFFSAEILRGQSAYGEAEEAYRRAQRARPSDPRPQALALEMMRLRKQSR